MNEDERTKAHYSDRVRSLLVMSLLLICCLSCALPARAHRTASTPNELELSTRPEEVHAILDDIPRLQERARLANGGALGCGFGRYTIVTSSGNEVDVQGGLDPIHVYGNRIKTTDLFVILNARAESNQTGAEGPASGDVSDLLYVCMLILSNANDPESIPVIKPLLDDQDEAICAWAAKALIRMAEADEELKTVIARIEFPSRALLHAKARSAGIPDWVLERAGSHNGE